MLIFPVRVTVKCIVSRKLKPKEGCLLNFRKKYMWLLTTTGEEILLNYHVVFVLYMRTGKLKLIISCLM